MGQDWENRILCSDESCIGVIGPDGRCKECGKPYEGDLPENFADTAPSEADTDRWAASSEIEDDDEAADEEGDALSDEEWEERRLCSDENCIGVIGPDGRCKECGKPA